jgi:hypothetical protein
MSAATAVRSQVNAAGLLGRSFIKRHITKLRSVFSMLLELRV